MPKNVKLSKKEAAVRLADHLKKQVIPEVRRILTEAKTKFTHGDNAGRDGMILALHVAISVLGGLSLKKDGLLQPLTILESGLRDLNAGSPPPFLKITKKYGKVRVSDLRLATKGAAAGALNVLIRHMSAQAAANVISAELKRQGVMMEGKKPVTLRALQLWQTQAKKDFSSPMGKGYDFFSKRDFETEDGQSVKSTVIEVLSHLTETFRIKDA